MNLLPRASTKLLKFSLAMEWEGSILPKWGLYHGSLLLVRLWLGGILSGIMEARNAKCFDHNSGATVGLSTGTLGIVEVIAVYFEVIFVGEVGFRYEHYVDLLLF